MKFRLERVHYMPKVLEPGVIYVSDAFETAAHLCACGCGSKIRTPLGPTEWCLEMTGRGPSLYPSVGNWQQVCQSHYFIRNGEVLWAPKWSAEEIAEGRRQEAERRRAHYDRPGMTRGLPILRKLWDWLRHRLLRH